MLVLGIALVPALWVRTTSVKTAQGIKQCQGAARTLIAWESFTALAALAPHHNLKGLHMRCAKHNNPLRNRM